MTTISRIAPTPSGYLHLGNAVNFLATWILTRLAGGVLRLRIDDLDSARTRPEYVEDIFRQLDWLGITWDEGPTGPGDFYRNHSQQLRLDRYRKLLEELAATGALFTCRCSRKEISQLSATGIYPGSCRGRELPRGREETVRVRVGEETTIPVNGVVVELGREMGDFVVWRRDDLPSYQLASLADDLDHGVNLIIRGRDLLASTAAQLYLARLLGVESFTSCRFVHHPLLFCEQGKKLSKSDSALSIAVLREQGAEPSLAYRETARLLGLRREDVENIMTLDDLYRLASQGNIHIFLSGIIPFFSSTHGE